MIHLTAKLVAAYLKTNRLAVRDIPDLIGTVHSALANAASPISGPTEGRQPFVPIRKSVTPGAIICLDCGKSHKMLKRHLGTAHGLSVDEYREKWCLAADYPMVAVEYAARRSQLAIKSGLGRRKDAVAAGESGPAEASTKKPRHQYPPSRWSRPTE